MLIYYLLPSLFFIKNTVKCSIVFVREFRDMSADLRRRCAKCHITAAQDENLRFHRFPLPGKHSILKARVWAEYCYPSENWSTEESLLRLHQQHKMLCSKHFDDSSYTSSKRERLNVFAIPTGCQSILWRLRQEENLPATETNTTPSEAEVPAIESTPLQSTSNTLASRVKVSTIASTWPLQSAADVKAPKAAKGILKDINISCTSELTPKKRKLYLRCRKNLSEIIRLRRKMKARPRSLSQILTNDENVENLLQKNITGPFALLLQSQLKNTPRKLPGRRWTIDDKVMALSIYKRSTACYRLLKRLFCLPSEGTLKALLNRIPMRCGINPQIFKTVKNITDTRTTEENLCILTFDEMSIRKNLVYNSKQDLIYGYQDHGNQGRTMEPATHALLFMAIGIRKKWKQPLAFYFSGDCVTADRLCALIKEVLDAGFEAGLDIVATVCDNYGVNIKALNTLGSSVAHPYFDFKGHEIVTIMDPPHLLKCFRNNFMKHDIECAQAFLNDKKPITGIAKWKYIKEFYEKDNVNPNFVFAPALTKKHIEPNFKQKMKVSLACQVLSHSVASGMLAKIANNELPQEAIATALIIEKIDQLFDALNGDTPDLKRGKKFLTNLTKRSPHLEFFKNMKALFEGMKFIGARVKPPSIDGFIRTLSAVERIFTNLQKRGINSLSTRRLNQDPLENCFGCIRNNCGCNPNPNTMQFVAALKTSILGNLLNSNKNKNCLDDDNDVMHDLKTFLTQTVEASSSTEPDIMAEVDVGTATGGMFECPGEMQACAYVCGFMVKNLGPSCNQCLSAMLTDPNTEAFHLFSSFKEYNQLKNSLCYVKQIFVDTVELAATTTNKFLKTHGCSDGIKNVLEEKLTRELNLEWLSDCLMHFEKNKKHIIVSTIMICLKRHCVEKNLQFAEEASKKALKRKLNIVKNA